MDTANVEREEDLSSVFDLKAAACEFQPHTNLFCTSGIHGVFENSGRGNVTKISKGLYLRTNTTT